MTRNKIHALLLAAAIVLSGAILAGIASGVSAQTPASAVPQSEKIIKARFEVLHMLYQSLQVRSLTDMRELHTFRYSPEIRDKMQEIFNAGGYQYGDKVEVWYKHGGDIAFKIKGKPSKPK